MKNPDEHPDNSNYECEQIRTAFQQHGITVSDGGLHHKHRIPYGIMKADIETQHEELIKRDFHSVAPLTKLLTYITGIACKNGKLNISHNCA